MAGELKLGDVQLYGMITGVKHGWLDAKIRGPAARKSWIAVVGYAGPEQ